MRSSGVARRQGTPKFSPVVVTRVTGVGDWSSEQAVDLLGQGYSVEKVAELTGFDRRWVAAQQRLAEDA